MIEPARTYPPSGERSVVAQKIGPYRLIRPISSGGMARVYEARRDSLAGVSTRVAVKVIHPDYASEEAFQELFISEARISSALEHQNLVRVQDFNRDGELYYLVMEFIEGLTLRRVISLARKHKLTLPLGIVAEIGRQVCEGLDYAHRLTGESGEVLGLIHRDIKPSNVMLNPRGVVKVLDFGISAGMGQRASGGVQGTWGYMPLEQADGRPVNAAADVFGLGAVLYEMVKLEPLLDDKDNNRIRERLIQDEAARRAAALGGPYAELGSILVRALQRDPVGRFQSAAELGRALSQLIINPVNVQDELKGLYQDLRRRDAPAKDGAAGDRPISEPTLPSLSGRRSFPEDEARAASTWSEGELGGIPSGDVGDIFRLVELIPSLQVEDERAIARAASRAHAVLQTAVLLGALVGVGLGVLHIETLPVVVTGMLALLLLDALSRSLGLVRRLVVALSPSLRAELEASRQAQRRLISIVNELRVLHGAELSEIRRIELDLRLARIHAPGPRTPT